MIVVPCTEHCASGEGGHAILPLSPVFPLSVSTCSALGSVGTAPVRLFEPSNSCVRFLKDDRLLGIEPVSEVDVRSRVCSDVASNEDAASVASGDGDNAWELTSLHGGVSIGHPVASGSTYRFCSPVRLVRLFGSAEPICELRTSARVERRVSPGEANSELGSAVMEVASRWRLVREVKLVNELGREPATRGTNYEYGRSLRNKTLPGIELPPMTSRVCSVVKPPISLGNVAGTPG